MGNQKQIKLAIFVCLLLTAAVVTGLLLYRDHQSCMNIPLIKEEALSGYTEDPAMDISSLLFHGEKAAVDLESGTIYISQPSDKLLHHSQLIGTLESTESAYSLYFMNNSAMQDIPKAVRSGEPLLLAVVNASCFRTVNVVITTLPVLRIEETLPPLSQDGQDIMTGDFILWGGSSPSAKDYRTVSGTTQWHVRGSTSSLMPKKSWKLSLKDANGDNKNQELLGLSSDDDWILNAMSLDDTRVRDKFTQDLWNQCLINTTEEYPMSQGHYVELIINDTYHGLYLLMRRVDAKYLKLDQQKDILLKGTSWLATNVQEGFEILSSPYTEEETYHLVENTLAHTGDSSICLESFIKTNLLINLCSAPDNAGYKNMFYVLHPSENGCSLYFIPWDMDMTMGLIWDTFYSYDYSISVNQIISRKEYNLVLARHPQLDEIMAARWQEYRAAIFSEENLEKLLTNNMDTICNSGAFDRDMQKWGCLYAGEDTHSALLQWCMERLSMLDAYYSR